MSDPIALWIALLALAVSIGTAWLTYFHRGKVRMTTPSMVVFAYDTDGKTGEPLPKVMVRSLLFGTGERGRVVESMFARLRAASWEQSFPVWGLDADSKLVRAGGLHVSKVGVVAWHHFVSSAEHAAARFTEGSYRVEVFARVLGNNRPVKLWCGTLVVPSSSVSIEPDGTCQVWFDRRVESEGYEARWESRPPTNQARGSLAQRSVASR